MKNLFFALTIGLFSFAATSVAAQTLTSRPVSAITEKDVAFLTEDILLDGSGGRSLKVAPLTSSVEGFGMTKLSLTSPAIPFSTMPAVNVPNPVTQQEALDKAKSWMRANVNGFTAGFGAWLASRGISQGIYNFSQEIMVQTDAGLRKRAIAFNLSLDSRGRAVYGDPKIVDPDPLVLEAIYIPKNTSEDLPQAFNYPDAGNIRYRVLNKRYEPISGWRLVNTNGAYDGNENDLDTTKTVSCLMDNRYPGCNSGPIDINRLMNQVGATYALVAYVNRIQPVYEGPEDNLQAVTAISVEERNFNCDVYENKGVVGYVLQLSVDQYTAQMATDIVSYRYIGTNGTYGVSPVTPYQKTVPVSALGGYHPDYFVINPYPYDNSLINRLDTEKMKNFVYIAPVVDKAPPPDIAFSGNLPVSSVPQSDDSRIFTFGILGDNSLGDGAYTWSSSFNVSGSFSEFTLTEVGYDDWFLIAINGVAIFNGPRGGDMLALVSGKYYEHNECSRAAPNDAYGGWLCGVIDENTGLLVPETRWANCQSNFFYTLMGVGWACTNSPCRPGQVQYSSGGGCGGRENGTNYHSTPNINLKPFLKEGVNTLHVRLIVGDKGEGWFRIRAKGCTSGMNLVKTNPPPLNRSQVESSIRNDADRFNIQLPR
jgi:hypothetical protein